MHRALFALWFVVACTPQTSPSSREQPSPPEPIAVEPSKTEPRKPSELERHARAPELPVSDGAAAE